VVQVYEEFQQGIEPDACVARMPRFGLLAYSSAGLIPRTTAACCIRLSKLAR